MFLSRNIIANKASWALGRTRARVVSFVAQGEVVLLAWPIASAMLGETIMGLVDTKLVGNLGAAALGGVGVAGSLLHLSYVTLLGLMRGVKVCTAYAVGRGQPYHGVRYAQVGVALGLMCGACCVVLFQYAAPALRAVQIGPDLIPHAITFLKARSWGLPATFALIALIEHRQGIGDVRIPMLVGLAGNVVNAFVAYGLIYGHYGLPALGVRGAGYGTSIVEVLQLLVLYFLLWRTSRAQSRVPAAMPELHWRLALRELLMVGLPTALHFGCETTAFVAFTAILGSLGDADVAAHQIAGAINRLAFLFGAAIGEAACILVGRALGAQRLDVADQAVRASVRVAALFMVACGLLFSFFGRYVAALFTNDPEVVHIVTKLLHIAALWQVLDAFNIVMRAALRGAKDVRAAAIIGISILWTCVPTSVYFLGKVMGLGVVGGWWGFLLATTFSAAFFSRRWLRGSWRRRFAPVAPAEQDLAAQASA